MNPTTEIDAIAAGLARWIRDGIELGRALDAELDRVELELPSEDFAYRVWSELAPREAARVRLRWPGKAPNDLSLPKRSHA